MDDALREAKVLKDLPLEKLCPWDRAIDLMFAPKRFRINTYRVRQGRDFLYDVCSRRAVTAHADARMLFRCGGEKQFQVTRMNKVVNIQKAEPFSG